MNTTLVIMAAGMGSRYGGLKQLEAVGPKDEAIIDYSVYDAAKAGFNHIIFIIREEIIPDFDVFLKNRYPIEIKIEIALQVNPVVINPKRIKPWGTAHAVLSAKEIVDIPFAIINADDFYGYDAFTKAFSFLNQKDLEHELQALIGYRLVHTLSPHGSVSRGICKVDKNQKLTTIKEILKIKKSPVGEIHFDSVTGVKQVLKPDTLVSMNFWCFQPTIFNYLDDGFKKFLIQNHTNLKTEYLIPEKINQLINKNWIYVKVEPTQGPWFGITYKEDKDLVCKSILKLTRSGNYPSPLWK